MSEKIYTRLLRLYPSHFRKEYEAEALQLIRDRLRDERGFYKRARLWWDLLTDIFVALPSAYQNSYTVTESASLSLNAAAFLPSKFWTRRHWDEARFWLAARYRSSLLAAFALLLSRQVAFRPLLGPNGRLSPIEAVMQHLNQPPVPDSPATSLPDTTAPSSSQMSAPQAQPTTPDASIPNTPASSSATAIPNDGQESSRFHSNTER